MKIENDQLQYIKLLLWEVLEVFQRLQDIESYDAQEKPKKRGKKPGPKPKKKEKI